MSEGTWNYCIQCKKQFGNAPELTFPSGNTLCSPRCVEEHKKVVSSVEYYPPRDFGFGERG